MSRTSRNFVFAYAFLVILPLVGLAGILKNGRSIAAPVSIDGVWTLQVDPVQLDSLPCGKVLAAIPDKVILISQSGQSFVLSFPGRTKVIALGTLDSTTVHATFTQAESSPESSCTGESRLSMLATVERRGDGTFLSGALSVLDCATCPSVAFRAERQAAVTPRGDS